MQPWLLDVLRCPEDGGALAPAGDGARCAACGREFAARDGVLELLPDRLRTAIGVRAGEAGTRAAHAHGEAAAPAHGGAAAGAPDEHTRWVADEMAWWNPWHSHEALTPYHAHSGLRGRARERHLLRHVRPAAGPAPLVLEMGAGTSRTVAGLWAPLDPGLRYVATDASTAALEAGREILPATAASVQCDAVDWPVREGVADVVLILGVLHHLSDWRAALERACRAVRPGGWLLLHEAVTKPRVLARWRSRGVDDAWVSPHEGDISAAELRAALARDGTITHWRGEESPLRFGLVRFVIQRYDRFEQLERSRALTVTFDALDQAFGRTFGRLDPSLGFNEVTVVWQRAR